MSWVISTQCMTRITSFSQAEAYWNGASAWKSEDSSWRPLAERRARHKRIVKLADGGYACVLYDTAMTTYYPDGSVLLNAHDSRSSHDFAHYVSPLGCTPVGHGGLMYWRVETPEGTRYYRPARERLHLRAVTSETWEVVGELPEAPTERVYDRKLGAAARKTVKPYVNWLALTERMASKSVNQYYTPPPSLVRHLITAPDDPEVYIQLLHAGGSKETVTRMAYEQMGAVRKVPTPYDRLPRLIR